jgi:outer membrane PBP1 activator LpoA protein
MLRVRSLACLAPLLLALSGCPSLTERTGLPPSVDRATQLEGAGDTAGAARVYEELAAHNSGAERNGFLLDAARDYLHAHHPEDAARVLTLTQGTLTAEQSGRRALLNVQLALERNERAEAARQLAAIPEPAGGELQSQYRQLKAQLAEAPVAKHPPSAATPAHPAAPEAGAHVALLLPVTGRAAAAAQSVRDGFLTAS